MQNLKSLLSQKLTWTFSKTKITLKSNDETMLELQEEKFKGATFSLDGLNYLIRNEGFWNAKTTIHNDGKQTLIMKRNFLGSKARIELENGNQYTCEISNSPLATLTFFNNNQKEIFFYKIDTTHKPETLLNIIDPSINETELLLLIILGCYSFKEIVRGSDDSDLLLLFASA